MANDNRKNDEKSLDDRIAEAVSKAVSSALTEAIPSAMMASAKMTADSLARIMGKSEDQMKAKEEEVRRQMAEQAQCSKCGIKVGGCKDKHVSMYVGPHNARRFKSFPGLFLNGVQFRSPRPGIEILVPAENNFPYQIAEWERSEEELLTGRTVEHDSGSISNNNRNGYKPFNGAGFRQ